MKPMKQSQSLVLTVLMLAMTSGVGCDELLPFSNSAASTASPLTTASQTLPMSPATRVAVATASAPPMLTDFPACQSTLDIGLSQENIQFGSLTTNIAGFSACFTVNNPIQMAVAEGPVQITIEAAVNALPAPTSAMRVARFAIEGRSSITGGMASTTPVWSLQAGYLFAHSGSPTGSEPIEFGASLTDVDDIGGGTPFPAVASVSIDCGVGVPTILPVNQGAVAVPVQATSICGASCSCTASARLSGGASATAGEAVQRLTVYAFNTNGLCGSNERCRQIDPTQPFCVANFGCSNGSVGMPCDHESECDRGAGVICDSAGFCADGSAGASCIQAGDCIASLRCTSSVCSAL